MDADSSSADRAARLRRLSGQLTRRIRSQAHGDLGLTISQEFIIAMLGDAPDGMTSAELARMEGVRAQTMSVAVAALEKAGYVRGVPDPADGRRTILHVTEQGFRAHGESRAAKQAWLQDLLGEFSADELNALDAGLELLERIAES
jgi:DNA-binding MarR family transcriptional regulator